MRRRSRRTLELAAYRPQARWSSPRATPKPATQKFPKVELPPPSSRQAPTALPLSLLFLTSLDSSLVFRRCGRCQACGDSGDKLFRLSLSVFLSHHHQLRSETAHRLGGVARRSSSGGRSFGVGHTFDAMSERLNYEENIETAATGSEDGIGTLPDEHLQTSFRGGNLFDRMSKRLHDEGNMERAVTSGEDRISALPDELLQYVMSFLLSRDSVRTCVLARRWQTLWKSVPALRIDDPESYDGATGSSTFVDELLRLRDPTPLNVCDISSDCLEDPGSDTDWANEAFQHMEPWLLYALFCQVQVLQICFPCRVINTTLISSHLKRLHLNHMYFEGCSLDFSSCEVLEVLEMRSCDIHANILSQSLRHLKIHTGCFGDARIRISAPNLIGFRLAPLWGLVPLLDSMPSLVTAAVKLQEVCEEVCYCGNLSCEGCDAQAGKTDYPVALGSLSVATNLKLKISGPRRLSVFSMDLKWRPMFSKLKTLLLNKWCVDDDFNGLIYFLQHSPILEMLTLLLDFESSEDYHLNETDESCNSREQSLLSQHLKKVKIICCTQEDVIVHRILKILCTHGVPFEKIEIE